MCVCVCVCVCVFIFWQHLLIYSYLIEHNRHFLPTIFFVNPFEFPYLFYDWWEFVPSVIISQVLSAHIWVIIRGWCITKGM